MINSINILFKKDIEEFINFQYDNLPLGKSVYSHYSRYTGIPTIDKIDSKLIFMFSKYLNYYSSLNKIINKNGIKHSVQSETQFIPASICYGICLNNNIKVYSRLKELRKFV